MIISNETPVCMVKLLPCMSALLSQKINKLNCACIICRSNTKTDCMVDWPHAKMTHVLSQSHLKQGFFYYAHLSTDLVQGLPGLAGPKGECVIGEWSV